MPTIRVFQFRCCDVATQTSVVAPLMATRDAVALGGGVLIKHSAQDVDAVLVDPLGFYPADILQRPTATTVLERLSALGLQPVSACPAPDADADVAAG